LEADSNSFSSRRGTPSVLMTEEVSNDAKEPTANKIATLYSQIHYLFGRLKKNQGCGSGLDSDSATLWIRIRIRNPDPGSGSRGKKIKKYQWKCTF
jgi:hypothetical protein